MGHQLLHGKSNLKPLVEFMIGNAGTHALEQQHFAASALWRGGEGVNGREHPVFALSSASTDKWMGETTACDLPVMPRVPVHM